MNLLKAFVAVALFAFTACESELKDLLDTTINIEMDEEIHVAVEEDDPLEYNKTLTFDAADEVSALEIKEYEVTKLTVEIANYTGEATKISDLSMSIDGTNISIKAPEVYFALINNQGPIDVPVDEAVLVSLAEQFADDNKATLNISATFDKKPVDFDMTISVEGKVTGSLVK